MNRLTLTAGIAAAACAVLIPAASALASDTTSAPRSPAQSRVDDHGRGGHGTDDATRTAAPGPAAVGARDDKGTHVEPGDDKGTHVEPGDDNGGRHGHDG